MADRFAEAIDGMSDVEIAVRMARIFNDMHEDEPMLAVFCTHLNPDAQSALADSIKLWRSSK